MREELHQPLDKLLLSQLPVYHLYSSARAISSLCTVQQLADAAGSRPVAPKPHATPCHCLLASTRAPSLHSACSPRPIACAAHAATRCTAPRTTARAQRVNCAIASATELSSSSATALPRPWRQDQPRANGEYEEEEEQEPGAGDFEQEIPKDVNEEEDPDFVDADGEEDE
ncbi:hypothetical protein EJB05_26654, partial [Eragrostis curvula]